MITPFLRDWRSLSQINFARSRQVYFNGAWSRIRQTSKTNPRTGTLNWETQIAVPAMWDAAAIGVMASAARDADLGYVNFREEPQCVAGAVMSWLLSQRFIEHDNAVIFFDVGAGTSDASVVRFRNDMRLERVGPSHGGPGGALLVNKEAWKAFVQRVDAIFLGGLAALCTKLKISQEDCQRQVHEQV